MKIISIDEIERDLMGEDQSLAENIRKEVLFYLQSTFDFRDNGVARAFERFLTDPDTGLFKGPWVQLRRPFRPADPEETVPFDFPVPFHPFKHQNRSWRGLTSKGRQPQPTIVTTGTGSGKTECFLFPILDHCLRARKQGQKGIKALILYPMNALAADQEKRFARVIWRTPALKAAGIRVGNYTGRYDPADPGADSGTRAMGQDHSISHHAVQQDDPPDILLTNYKMLDYLLLRPQDQGLWRFNREQFPAGSNPCGVSNDQEDPTTTADPKPETGNWKPATENLELPLRYLVLDELHTYDGAQGADVACLIRRLKERLAIPKGELCVVGTSATLDDREPSKDSPGGKPDGAIDARETGNDRLVQFACTLFEEEIPADAVIGEDRLTVEEIVHPDPQEVTLPDQTACQPLNDEDPLTYARRQSMLWGGPKYVEPEITSHPDPLPSGERGDEDEAVEQWAFQLGEWLKGRQLFKDLLDLFHTSEVNQEGPLTWHDLVRRLAREELGFNDHPL